MKKIILTAILSGFILSSFSQPGISHQSYDELLRKYVNEAGMVDYKGLQAERSKLESYLGILEANAPKESWTEDEKLAYWINAYNAYTLDLILTHYPIKSIKDLGSTIKIPFVSTAWDIKFINIGGEEYDLNKIEHGIIRKEFDEPRIHFALVCAAISCPKLQSSAYFPETLEAQLASATREFLADVTKNEFKSAKKAVLSKLFNWYGGDFNNDGTLIEFLNQYSSMKLETNAKISWLDYDWGLNEQ